MPRRRGNAGALRALARLRRALEQRANEFSDPLDHEVALEIVDLELRAVAGVGARGRTSKAVAREALTPRSRKRTPIDSAIVAVLKRRTGFGGPDAELGMTTAALGAAIRAAGVRVADETVRRRALALARERLLSADKWVFTVQQPQNDWQGPELFGGSGRCLRRQWHFAVPGPAHIAGAHVRRER